MIIDVTCEQCDATFEVKNDAEDPITCPECGNEVDLEEENGPEPEPHITVNDLNFNYGNVQALQDVNLEIPKRKVTAVIGPSGCGKTTFLRTLNRMYETIPIAEVEGEVRIDGTNILREDVDPVELRKMVGMVFQSPNPFPKSIYDNVSYGMEIQRPRLTDFPPFSFFTSNNHNPEELEKSKDPRERSVVRSLKASALWDEVKNRLDESAMDLSGGQQQRLCIARAIATKPSVILLDEPASALDPSATSKIEDLIHKLKKTYTIVIVSHNMQQAARVSDYTMFLYKGELIEWGKTDKIFTRPKKQMTQDYITGRFG